MQATAGRPHNAIMRAAAAAALLGLAACTTTAPRAAAPPMAAVAAVAGLDDTRTAMVRSARAMLGQPYKWGGAAPGGFDCSGLVEYSAAQAGLRVPRTARQQKDFGAVIERGAVRPGDLVFMHLSRKELHVGIALDADRFIHAPSTGGSVRIDSLNGSAYGKGFVGARRIIGGP